MADLFVDGQQSSASTLTDNMQAMVDTGQQIVDTMEQLRISSLLQIQRDLDRLNGYRCQAFRAPKVGIAASFLVSDFADTDQTKTNATVRIDSASVTLRERKNPGNVVAQSITFASNSGTVEQFGEFYRVTSDSLPVGTFNVKLAETANISFIIIDFAPTPSIPNINIQVSQNGITFTDATQITTSGYRASVWLAPQEVQYVQVIFSPTHPDTLGGNTYTFGINDFYAYSVEFQLQSDWVSRSVAITPSSYAWIFNAPTDPRLLYFLSLDGGVSWQEVSPGQQIQVPGSSQVSVSTTIPATIDELPNTNGQLDESLADGYIPSTLKLLDSNGNDVPIATGLALGSTGLTDKYLFINDLNLYIQPITPSDFGATYQLSYVYV